MNKVSISEALGMAEVSSSNCYKKYINTPDKDKLINVLEKLQKFLGFF